MGEIQVYRGTLVHSTSESHMEIQPDRAVGVQDGKIVFIEKGLILPEVQRERGIKDGQIYHLPEGWFMLPGFVDCSLPATQYVFTGTGSDASPLDWMTQYKQPANNKMHDDQFAASVFQKAVNRGINNGTTTAVYNPSGISSAARLLCNTLVSTGQRAWLGLEIYLGIHDMDLHESQIELAEDFIQHVQKKHVKLLHPYINQSWLLPVMLENKLKTLQDKYDIPIKTTLAQISKSGELFEHRDWIEMDRSSTHHLWNGEVLNSKAILTHCVHCSEEDLDLIKKKDAAVVHCPNSNISKIHGTCDVRKLKQMGVRIGLGTDAGGGTSASMLDAMRRCVEVSKIIKSGKPAHYRHITIREAFSIATMGGAQVLGLENVIGNFEVGKDFDAIFVDPDVEDGPFDIFLEIDKAEDIVEKFLNLGDERNIKEVYVCGRQVR